MHTHEVRIPYVGIDVIKAIARAYRAMLAEGVSPLDSVEWGYTMRMDSKPDGSW